MILDDNNFNKLPKVSIIIVNYNGRNFLDACLTSIIDINYPRNKYEVIFVDNASTDKSVEYVHTKFPWVKILQLTKNYGYTGGNNRGAKIASGDLLVFLNNDTLVDKNWLYELVKTIYIDSKIGVCGSKIISMRDQNIVQYNGFLLHFLGGVIPADFYRYENEFGQKFNIVGSVQGSSFIIKKSVFKDLHGFEDDYFLYGDETDICHRAWISGYYVAYAPNSIIYHYGGGTVGTLNNRQAGFLNKRLISSSRIYYGNKNAITNIIKNLELRNMLSGIFFTNIYLFMQFFILLKDKDFKNIKLLLHSYLWPIKNMKCVWRKRVIVQANRKVSDKELIKKRILLSITDLFRRIIS